MAELRHAFGSANVSTQCGLNEDWGAGANAVSRIQKMYLASSSLSELVWSPSKGLGIKCTDYSYSNEDSFLWFPESSNMIILPSRNIDGKEIEDNGFVIDENLCSKDLESKPDNESFICGTVVRSPKAHENIQWSSEIKEPMMRKLPVMDADISRDDELAKKEMDICSDVHRGYDLNESKTGNIGTLHDNASAQAQDNARSANSASDGLQETNPEIEGNAKGCSSDEIGRSVGKKNSQAVGLGDVLVSEDSKTKQSDYPRRFMPLGLQDIKIMQSPAFDESSGNKLKPESIAENDIKSSKTEGKLCCRNTFFEVGMVVASQPEGEGRHSPDNKVMMVEMDPSDRKYHLSISNEEEKSNNSLESSNSGKLYSKRGRVRSFEHQAVIGNKKIKKHQSETPYLSSFVGHDSSFMNWISSMIKGISKSDSDTRVLALPAEPSNHQHESHNSQLMSHYKSQTDPVCKSTGFQTIFQSMYCPRESIQNKTKTSIYQLTEMEGSKELEAADEMGLMPCDNDSPHISCEEEKSEPHKNIDTGTSAPVNLASASLAAERQSNLHDIAFGSKSDEVHFSDSCFKRNLILTESKADTIHGSVDPSKLSNSIVKRSPVPSLWISRFTPKTSTPLLKSGHCLKDKSGTVEGFTDCNRFLPLSENIIVSMMDKNNMGNGHELSPENKKIPARRSLQNSVASPTGSCGSRQVDQKFKPKLSPIQPSQRFKDSEAMASVFARRLDALKHITPSNVTGNATPDIMFCFYCGKRGHILSCCSEIMKSELKDFLKYASLHDRLEETSCFCIRCFQFSHWAVACSFSSSRRQTYEGGNNPFVVGETSKGIQEKLQNQNSLVDSCEMSQTDNLRPNNVVMSCTNKITENTILKGEVIACTNKIIETPILKGTSDIKSGKKGFLGDNWRKGICSEGTENQFAVSEKNAAASLKESDLNKNQIMSCVNKLTPTIPGEIFEIIRRLRLSRAVILKWMKSPSSNFQIEGFFLRLRLGKGEEGLGGTGYEVACINGTSQGSSTRNCKRKISVDVGGLKCSIDCRYVSNHDFVEDELKAWWSANLKVAGKIPRVEELHIKLEEKKKYGL